MNRPAYAFHTERWIHLHVFHKFQTSAVLSRMQVNDRYIDVLAPSLCFDFDWGVPSPLRKKSAYSVQSTCRPYRRPYAERKQPFRAFNLYFCLFKMCNLLKMHVVCTRANARSDPRCTAHVQRNNSCFLLVDLIRFACVCALCVCSTIRLMCERDIPFEWNEYVENNDENENF